MKINILITLLTLFIVQSCDNGEKRFKAFKDENKINEKEEETELIIPEKDIVNTLENAKAFTRLMHDTNSTVISFYPDSSHQSKYVEAFSQIGLDKIYGLGNKRNEKYKTINYSNLDIYLFEYHNELYADSSYEMLRGDLKQITSSAVRGRSEIVKKKPNLRLLDSKYGGNKGNISLSCKKM